MKYLMLLIPFAAIAGNPFEDHAKDVAAAHRLFKQIYLSQAAEAACMHSSDPEHEFYLAQHAGTTLRVNCADRNEWVTKYRAGLISD